MSNLTRTTLLILFMLCQLNLLALDTSNLTTNGDALPINIYRRAHGDASLTTAGGFYNMEVPFKNNVTRFYSFGGYTYKFSDAFAFTRNFSARPDRFATDFNGDLMLIPTLLFLTVWQKCGGCLPELQGIKECYFVCGN